MPFLHVTEIPIENPHTVQTASGVCRVDSTASIDAILDGHRVSLGVDVLETDEVTPILVGNERLQQLGASFDYGSGVLSIPGECQFSFQRAGNNLYYLALERETESVDPTSLPRECNYGEETGEGSVSGRSHKVALPVSAFRRNAGSHRKQSHDPDDDQIFSDVAALIQEYHEELGHAGVFKTWQGLQQGLGDLLPAATRCAKLHTCRTLCCSNVSSVSNRYTLIGVEAYSVQIIALFLCNNGIFIHRSKLRSVRVVGMCIQNPLTN